ncbi:nucleotidyltransferase domain-containing protein [Candidatus Woesearchaeota archaeon]|nr:nucleotidyltransferase domain-containing protein [Candidatus Woesearchaeota archaeon]
MLTAKELQIIELFRQDIFAEFTIREIMKKISTKSYSWTHNAVKKLQKENIITLKKKGQSQLCNINLEEQESITYLSLLEELNSLNKKLPNLKKIIELMPIDFHILLIAGSYADNTFTKQSDMDIVTIIDKKEEKKWLLNKLSNKGELMIPILHPYVFTVEEFLEMLKSKEPNYGKEIARKHMILSGAEAYFKILREASKHGYNG